MIEKMEIMAARWVLTCRMCIVLLASMSVCLFWSIWMRNIFS